MQDKKITTLGEFSDSVHEIRERWGVADHKELWFRGEAERYDTPLRPRLYRAAKPVQELLDLEYWFYEYFQRCGAALCDKQPEEESGYWDWYFLMQHHGSPTRLLDWSDGAMIALHFALRDKVNRGDAVVYVVESYQLADEIKALPKITNVKKDWEAYLARYPRYPRDADDWDEAWLPDDQEGREILNIPPMPLVLEFPHITRRVGAQRSRFILFGTEPTWLSDKLTSLCRPLESITIDGKATLRLKVELRESGVTESVVFPDLDGLGREVNQLWQERIS